mmetsp:Transcript_11311/g.21306  ORF Transcript_11311/g.21306 Transcript_11311/m.21306 type:complete len:345 (+) Transcript_11311:85-1119(+)
MSSCHWPLAVYILGSWQVACAQPVYCRVAILTALEGEISGVGAPLDASPREDGCAWHILPSLSLQGIDFTLEGDAHFEGYDALAVYGSGTMHSSTRVATFQSTNPLPRAMALTGTSEALFVLSAASNQTHFRLRYACRPYGTKLGDTWFSPVGYACVLAAFIVLGFAISLMPVYMVCYCKARRHQDLILQESQLMIRSELARRFRESEAVRAEELQVVASLQALPLEKYESMCKHREAEAGRRPSIDECCLCLEPYAEEDVLRALPCRHYFHQACIDKWFVANRFMPRSCPLCKADPVASVIADGVQAADAAQDGEVDVPPRRPEVGAAASPAVLGRPQPAWEA